MSTEERRLYGRNLFEHSCHAATWEQHIASKGCRLVCHILKPLSFIIQLPFHEDLCFLLQCGGVPLPDEARDIGHGLGPGLKSFDADYDTSKDDEMKEG